MKTTLSLILILTAAAFAKAQPGPGCPNKQTNEKIKAEKIAFITQKLDLTPEEAQQFWPVYNEMEKKRFELHNSKRDILIDNPEKIATLSAAEKEKAADTFIELHVAEAALMKEYHEKFKKILQADKLILLYIAEKEFKRDLLNRFRQEKFRGGR